MGYWKKILLFFTFVFVSSIFFACSEDLLGSLGGQPVFETSGSIGRADNISVNVGFRDSVGVLYVGIFTQQDGLKKDSANYIENTVQHVREFHLTFDEIDGADEYEVRVSKIPITADNWGLANLVTVLGQEVDSTGAVLALCRLNPEPIVMESRCVGCGSCDLACPVDAIKMVNNKSVIDPETCINCGLCYQACDYNTIQGTFAGLEYYVAVRGKSGDSLYSKEVTCTEDKYKIRYVTVSEIPDGTLVFGGPMKKPLGCHGNCTDGSSGEGSRIGDCNQCYILSEKACPVDAVFEVDADSIEAWNTTAGAMFIDKDKCINCGQCVVACYELGPHGSVTTEVVRIAD